MVTIPGATKVRQAQESAGAMNFVLSANELAKIDANLSKIDEVNTIALHMVAPPGKTRGASFFTSKTDKSDHTSFPMEDDQFTYFHSFSRLQISGL